VLRVLPPFGSPSLRQFAERPEWRLALLSLHPRACVHPCTRILVVAVTTVGVGARGSNDRKLWVRARQLAFRANLPRAAVAAVDTGVGYAHPPEGGRVQSRPMRDDKHSAGLCAGRRPEVAPPVQWRPRVGPL
jgi:hypothetical protein